MDIKQISVEVAYARPDKQQILKVSVPVDCTIETAIDRSGVLEIFPEIDLTQQKVGIFGVVKKLSSVVKEGDRIEIYRKLVIDPKEARRLRAKKKG